MERAASGKLNRRGPIVALAAALILPVLAPAVASAGPAYGGTGPQGSARPMIVGLTCLSRCGASSASRATRAVNVRPNGVLKVRGRNLSGVRTVIFTGRAGARDDVRVSPSGVGRLSVDVSVPARAVSGRIVLLVGSSQYSSPSAQLLVVARASGGGDDDGDDEDKKGKDDGDDDSGDSSPPSSQGLIWPVPRAPIFGVFGENRGSHFHAGVDISGPVGTPIRAAAAGRVLFAGPSGAYGNYICLSHNTVATCYAHLADMTAAVGNSVSRGSLIGHIGLTGNSRGAHLHFEVRQGLQMWGTPVNPMAYLPGAATARSSAVTQPLDYGLPFAGPTG